MDDSADHRNSIIDYSNKYTNMLANALKDSIDKYKQYKFWKYEKYETAYLIKKSSNKDGWCLFDIEIMDKWMGPYDKQYYKIQSKKHDICEWCTIHLLLKRNIFSSRLASVTNKFCYLPQKTKIPPFIQMRSSLVTSTISDLVKKIQKLHQLPKKTSLLLLANQMRQKSTKINCNLQKNKK